MRFTLRDLFWLTVVAACCCGWWIAYRTAVNAERELKEATRLWAEQARDDPFTHLPALARPKEPGRWVFEQPIESGTP